MAIGERKNQNQQVIWRLVFVRPISFWLVLFLCVFSSQVFLIGVVARYLHFVNIHTWIATFINSKCTCLMWNIKAIHKKSALRKMKCPPMHFDWKTCTQICVLLATFFSTLFLGGFIERGIKLILFPYFIRKYRMAAKKCIIYNDSACYFFFSWNAMKQFR